MINRSPVSARALFAAAFVALSLVVSVVGVVRAGEAADENNFASGQEFAAVVAMVKNGEPGALELFSVFLNDISESEKTDVSRWNKTPDPDASEEEIVRYELVVAHELVEDAAAYSETALGNQEYDEEYYGELAAELDELEWEYPALRDEAVELIAAHRENGGKLRGLREDILGKYQDEIRQGSVNPGTRLAWSMVRVGIGMPKARLTADSLTFSEDEASLNLSHDGADVSIVMHKDDIGKRVRATIDGYVFSTGWTVLFQKPLYWMLTLSAAMRGAGVSPDDIPVWIALEAPEGLVALGMSKDSGEPFGGVPSKVFFRGRLFDVEPFDAPVDADAMNRRFLDAAAALHEGIMGDESISRPLRQALHPVFEGTYKPVDPRDYFDGDFCRRLIEADYLESHIKPFPPERARELAAYREALARIEAGYDRFAVNLGEDARLVAVVKTDVNPDGAGGVRLDPESGEAVPPYEWRLEEKDSTIFHSPLPARYLYAMSLSEQYLGRHRVKPAGVPDVTELWHAVLGRIGGYREGDKAADGGEDLWVEAVTLDCRGRLDKTSGPLGWNFPFHVLQRDGQGDPVRIATARGVVDSPDFSGIADEDERRGAEDAWLDHAAATFTTPGQLGLIYHHFFRYCSDSPLPEMPNLIGSHYGLSDTHQTVYQSLERRWVGRLIGDCDDLAEFFQVLTARQGKLSHVMQVPAHAAAGFVERTDDGEYRFVVLQTGPVLQFTDKTLYGAVEAAYRSFDSDRGNSRITSAAVPILLRFADEDTRTPFVLSARIYEDREYAETMIRVQEYWHLFVFSSAIDEMEDLVRHDRETGNLKELASLYEQVGRFDESDALRLEELAAARGDTPAVFSTLLDLANLHVKAKDKPKALEALTEMEELFHELNDNGDPLFARVLPFRSSCAVLLARMGEPARALALTALDVEPYIERGSRPPEYLIRVLVAIYDRVTMADDGTDTKLTEARAGLERVLDASFGIGYFRHDDTYNRIMSRYFLLGKYALAAEGWREGVRLLNWDGPYPEGSREHVGRRRSLLGADWEWFRITPDLYLNSGLEMLDQDDLPELYDPVLAGATLEAVPRAVEKGRRLGAGVVGDEAVLKSSLVLSFLNRDLDRYVSVMTEVREKNYSSLYDDAAVMFGNHCGLVPATDFAEWIEAFHRFFPGRQHYFKAAYRALDKEYFEHALMLARVTPGFFPEDQLLAKESVYLIEAIPVLRERIEARKAEEAEKSSESEADDEEDANESAEDVSFVVPMLPVAG